MTIMTKLHLFWLSLKSHPGVPMVVAFELIGVIAGLGRVGSDVLFYALLGFFITSFFWIPVLWTAWTQKNAFRHDQSKEAS